MGRVADPDRGHLHGPVEDHRPVQAGSGPARITPGVSRRDRPVCGAGTPKNHGSAPRPQHRFRCTRWFRTSPSRWFERPYLSQPFSNKRGTFRLLPDTLSGLFPFPLNTSLIYKKYVNLDLIVRASDPIFDLIPLESIKGSPHASQIPPQDQ